MILPDLLVVLASAGPLPVDAVALAFNMLVSVFTPSMRFRIVTAWKPRDRARTGADDFRSRIRPTETTCEAVGLTVPSMP